MKVVRPDTFRKDCAARFESLENRQLMSGVTLSDGVLRITGLSDQGNAVSVRAAAGKVYAMLNGATTRYQVKGLTQIRITGGDANDLVEVDASVGIPVRIQGLGGRDRLSGGAAGDVIEGGAGNDTIYGNGGADAINGGSGNDRIYGNAGNDAIAGGTGGDLLFGGDGADAFVRVDTQDKIYGGAGADTMSLAKPTTTQPTPTLGTTPTGGTTTKTVKVASLSLMNADTGKVIAGYEAMKNGNTLDLSKLPTHLTVQANLSGGSSTVRFDIDGHVGFHAETSAPYSLNGDGVPVTFSVGKHTIVASTLVNGKVASSEAVTFNVTKPKTTTTTPPKQTTPTTGSTDTTPTPPAGDNSNVGTPVAVIKAISATVPAGTSVHVDALSSSLKGGEWNDGKYVWDFGDAGGSENAMRGFNAAHTYDTAGTYTVKLAVTNVGGKVGTATMTVTVTPAARKAIYVAANGSDSYDGSSTSRPVQTIARAEALLGSQSNVEILFRRGDTFSMTSGFSIKGNNVVIGAYGSGTKLANILWTGTRDNQVMFYVNRGTSNFTAQDLSIDTIFNQDQNDSGTPSAFQMGGTNFTARRCTLLNLQFAFNLNMDPTGVMIQGNTAPLLTGLRKYFVWVQGSHVTIADNFAANSTREHIVRANKVSMLNVSDNDFSNISRRDDGDYWDYRKTALNIQSGEFAYAYNNKLDASFQVGPLGLTEGDTGGFMTASMRFNYAVGDGNEVFNDQMVINHGAQHVTMRDNVIHEDNNLAITVDGYDSTYQRGVVDLTLQNNTVVNNGTSGSFLRVYGAVDGIKLIGNLYLAPHLAIGSNQTAVIKLEPGAYDSFTDIDDNIWPVAATTASWIHEQGINYIGAGYVAGGFLTADEWNALKAVGTDTFKDVTPSNSYSFVLNGVRIGAKLAA